MTRQTARQRLAARVEAAHTAATAPASWRCMVDPCPQLEAWQPAPGKAEADAAAHAHYLAAHYRPQVAGYS